MWRDLMYFQSNILITVQDNILVACISDFGSAKFSFAKEYDIALSTKSGVLDWLSPECVTEITVPPLHSTPIPASDIWSWGCTFLEVSYEISSLSICAGIN